MWQDGKAFCRRSLVLYPKIVGRFRRGCTIGKPHNIHLLRMVCGLRKLSFFVALLYVFGTDLSRMKY